MKICPLSRAHHELDTSMQSTKDSKGGKTHPSKKSGSNHGGKSSAAGGEKKNNPGSPTGSHKRGEKKTTP
ncbi:Hypothetical protein Rta_00100 [Ramlibacter tataouinensis TTB310]|uniref:Uncharacterized protein n=2 Tax=Ramlibacter tataouinensis TaxID=94132 RepID=F5Y296_RAMTT|nr:Hypothetical protein Rta_00100 [Ramlibacter tataouinensis TTB310]